MSALLQNFYRYMESLEKSVFTMSIGGDLPFDQTQVWKNVPKGTQRQKYAVPGEYL